MIKEIVGYDGMVKWNSSMPDGQLKRHLDTDKAYKDFGFKSEISLETGLKKTIDWYECFVIST